LSKISDFNHLKINFCSKNPKKSNKIIKNQQGQKSRKHVGTCWRQIKPQKAMWQQRMILIGLKLIGSGACVIGFEHVLKRKCAPLGEVAHSREGSLPLERWRTLYFINGSTSGSYGVWGEVAALSHTLGSLFSSKLVRPPSPHGAPSFIGNSTHLLYIEAFSLVAS
jgi:hypothetical protein